MLLLVELSPRGAGPSSADEMHANAAAGRIMTFAAYEAHLYERLGIDPDAGPVAFESAQSARLAATVAEARVNSPFYRRRSDWPEALFAGIADLAELPFTTPADLARADPPLAAVSGADVARIVTLPTSGTSGTPKRVAFTAAELAATVEYFRWGMSVFTESGDRVAIAFASDRPASVGDGLAAALTRLGAVPVPLAATDPAALIGALREHQPDVVAGPPVTLLAAARLGLADGGPPVRLNAVLVSSDYASSSLKRAIAAAWRSEVYEHWGMTETGYGGAVDCPAHQGLHLRASDLYVEVIDPATGRPVPSGQPGEIVLTTLQPRAVPLVRYRTGDRGRLIVARCACGSLLPRLAGLEGRIDEAVPLGAGAILTLAAIDEAAFAVDGVSDIEATLRDGPPPTLALRIAAPPALRSPALAEAVRAAVAAVPDWAEAVASGALRLEISLADTTHFARPAKRRLTREAVPCASSG